jgi:putative ATP-binding cassette transporter
MNILTDIFRVIALLARMAREIKYSRWAVGVIVLAGVAGGVSNTILIALINSALGAVGSAPARAVWGYAALCLVLALTRFVSGALLVRITQKAVCDLRVNLCRQILAAPLRLLEQLGPHRLFATLTNDVPSVTNALVILPLLCMNITVLLGCLGYLGWLSWRLLLGVLAVMVVGIISHQIPVMRATRHFGLAREWTDALFKHLRALVEGMKELKLHRERRGAFLSRLLEPAAHSVRRETVTAETIWTAAGSWDQVLLFIVLGFVVFAVPAWQGADARTLTGYTLTILYMMGPLEFILNTLPRLGQADVAMRKIEEVSAPLAGRPAADGPAAPARAGWASLELDGVTHSYEREGEESSFILGPVSLSFRPGEVVFITGGNGSGKTTLAKLLTGLYAPESGEIRLDGEPVTDANRDAYRQLFSAVFSDFYLFEELLGLESLDVDAKARGYLQHLQLSHKVGVEGGKLSTVELSQGQRKRLALLAAYLEDRPVYVFDEWAADQDPHFKEVFYLQVLPGLVERGKTVIAITHDQSYYHFADRVVRLDDGKLLAEAAPKAAAPAPAERPSYSPAGG